MSIQNLIGFASNIVDGQNPSFTPEDFLELMPSFSGNIPEAVLEHYVTLAHSVVKEARWHGMWKEGMRLFIAHYLTLYLMSTAPENADAVGIINAGGTNGVATSKSVGQVSVNYDVNIANGDLNGWAAWKLTTYGSQYATMARLLGKAGMYVH